MRRATVGVMASSLLAALVFPGRARACEPALPDLHTIDPAMAGVDQTPPQLAQPTVSDLRNNDTGGACTPKCGADHSVTLTNLATDDMSPVNKIGYRVTAVAGNAPTGASWVGQVINGAPDGTLALHWDGGDDFDFSLQLVAIDAAGNESAPQTVLISSGGGGCRVGGRHGRGGGACLVVALALASAAARRRRRRAGA